MEVLDPLRLRSGTEIVRQTINAAATTVIDRRKGQHTRINLGASILALSIQNWPPNGIAGQVHLEVAYLGSHTIAWPAGTKWPGGISPTLTGVSGKTDHFMLLSSDNGATVFGFIMGQNY